MSTWKNDNRVLMLGIAAALAGGSIAPAFAQQATGGLEEIVVTALRREQSANNVGVAASVLTGSTLTDMGIVKTEDVVATLPNVVMTSIFGPGTNPNWSIRGVTSNDYNDATEAPIAVYIDDVYLVSTGAGSTPFFDMARVEVLRGPQGTSFGRQSTGGAVQFISNEPDKTSSGGMQVSYGSYDLNRFQGFVNTPLTDSVQVRLAGFYSSNKGFMPNVTGVQPDAGQRVTQGARGQIAFEPNDSIRDVLKLSYSNSYGRTTGIWHDTIGVNPQGFLVPVPGPDAVGQPPQYGWHGYNGQDRELKAGENYLAINKLTWTISDKSNLTSITAFDHYLRDVIEDCDGGALSECNTHYRNPSHQYSQEFRLFFDQGAQRYTVGAYGMYQWTGINHTAPLFQQNAAGAYYTINAAGNPVANGIALLVHGAQWARGEALFANGEFDVADKTTLIAGLRVSEDQKHIWHDYKVVTPVNPLNPFPDYIRTPNIAYGSVLADNAFNDQTAGGLNHFTKNLVGGKLELDYRPVAGNLLYVSFNRGVKAPGYNNGFISGGLAPNQYLYKAETLNAFEIGDKATLLDHRLQLNTDVYYYNYKNYDTLNYAGVGSLITNADAKTYGFEFDATARPDEHWYFSLNGSVANSTLFGTTNTGGLTYNSKMPILAKWTLSGRVGYQFPMAGEKTAGIEADGRATDKVYNNPQNDPAATIPGYAVFNARLYYGPQDKKWEASLDVRNLANRLYSTQIFALLGVNSARYGFYGDPRWITASLNFKF
jgi:iron complex outermembrane receptor protein